MTKVRVTKWAILSNIVCWEKKVSSILTGPPRSARGIGQHCLMLVLENGFLVNKGCRWQEARVLTIALSLQRLQPTPPCLLVKYWSSVHGYSLISWRTDWMKTRMQLKQPIWPGVGDWGSWTSVRSVIHVYGATTHHPPTARSPSHHLKIDSSLRLIPLGLLGNCLPQSYSQQGRRGVRRCLLTTTAFHSSPRWVTPTARSAVPSALQTLGKRQNKSRKRELVEFSILSHACSIVFLG